MWVEVKPVEYDPDAEESAREEVRRQIGFLMRALYAWLLTTCDSHAGIRSVPMLLRKAPLELDRLHHALEHEPERYTKMEMELVAGRLTSVCAEIQSAPSPEPFQKAVIRYLELWRT